MKDIYVFGRGEYFELKKETIEREYRIIGFLDNAARPEEEDNEIPVYRPERITSIESYPIMIMGSRVYFLEMALQLSELGVNEKDILFGVNLTPALDAAEELIQQHGGLYEKDGLCRFSLRGSEYIIESYEAYVSLMFRLLREENKWTESLVQLPDRPLSRAFGRESGEPIDRVYIEGFLRKHQKEISGVVGEIGEDTYTKQFGTNVRKSIVFHLTGRNGAVIGNLETGEGLEEGMVDCLICTQTIQMIYDLPAVARNIYKMLKPGGVALITGHGISQMSLGDDAQWGEYWRFTRSSLNRIFQDVFGEENVVISSYGNVKTTTCFLYGLVQEDMTAKDYEYDDPQYPVIFGIRVRK